MVLKRLLSKLWKKPVTEPELTPEYIETLPSADDVTFYRDSRRLLQRFDEYITSAEAEVEALSIELDGTLDQESILEVQLKTLNKPDSWHERHLLLKLDRLRLHATNLKQRIEIYSQNIKIYLNLISKIQDIKAMRMNGLDEQRIETIWVEFKETLENYKNKLLTEAASDDSEPVTTHELEDRLKGLKQELLPQPEPEKPITAPTVETIRPPIEDAMEVIDKSKKREIAME